ncbi:MAG: toluene hydroxylase [Kyrpidia tusciae]|nr:toluene hydroxylase [Kyrpidia tusciae]MBE3552116.1 toluene hydroxylase [Kyrpidia tusciae]
MAFQPKTIEPIRKQPWDWLTKNEYEEVTVREQPYLHGHYRFKYGKTEYDIYDPRFTRIRVKDWDAFRDPKRLWYETYTLSRKKMAEDVEGVFDRAQKLGIYNWVSDSWKAFAKDFYTPLRHYEYAGAVQLQHVVRYAMGCPIEQTATYTAFDKQGRAQWLSVWALEVVGDEGLPALERGRDLWVNDKAYDGLRRYMEHVLVAEDWAEALVALHLTLGPLLDRILYQEMNEVALAHRDAVIPELALVCAEQVQWQEQWTETLFKMVAEDPTLSRWEYLKALGYENWPGDYRWGKTLSDPRLTPEEEKTNREILESWVNQWLPRAVEAVKSLQSLMDRHGIAFSVEQSVDRNLQENVYPRLQRMGILAHAPV